MVANLTPHDSVLELNQNRQSSFRHLSITVQADGN
jgi:hypothetical protein